MGSLADNFDIAIRSAPEVYKDPSIAITAATAGGDVQQTAEVTAHALNMKADTTAFDKVATRHGGHGLFGASLSWLGSGIKSTLDVAGGSLEKMGRLANKPLSEVQHEYRYLRDVTQRHGFAAGLFEGAIMAGAGAVGTVLSGGNLAAGVLAAEGAGSLLGRTTFNDSWDRTNSATYVDSAGQAVSPGRDFARAANFLTKHVGIHIEQHPGLDLYDVMSGAGDGIFDLTTDPLMKAGALHKGALGEEGLKGILSRWGGTAMTAENVPKAVATFPSVRNAFEHIATLDAGGVAARYKKFKGLATELGAAKTADEVGQVFVDKAIAGEMTGVLLPRRAIGKAQFSDMVAALHEKASTAMLNPEGNAITRGLGKAEQRVTNFVPTSYNKVTQALSRTTLYFNDASSARTIYDMAKWGHTEGVAQSLATEWANGNIQQRMMIYRNVQTQNLVNRMEAVRPGWAATADGQETIAHIADRIDHIVGDIDAGRTTPWGFDKEGRIISKMEQKGETISHPILENQHINVPLPDYLTFDRNLKALGNGSELYGHIDDFLYKGFTQSVFKKWVLASGGFAFRVSSAELIPQILKDPVGIAKGKVVQSLTKRGWTLEAGEEDHVLAAIAKAVGRRTLDDKQLEFMANATKTNGGEHVPSALSTNHGQGEQIIGREEYTKDAWDSIQKDIPRSQIVHDEISAFGPDAPDHGPMWQKQAEDIGTLSPASRSLAAAYRDALALPHETQRLAEEAANKAADQAAEAAIRRAATRRATTTATGATATEEAAGTTAAEELSAMDAAAQKAAAKAARDVAEENIPPQPAAVKAAKKAKPLEPLSEELQAIVTQARQQAYDAAYQAALNAGAAAREGDAALAATKAAKAVLDETPEEILDKNLRHFYSGGERAPGSPPEPKMKWVPSAEAAPGVPSVRAHWEYDAPVKAPELVSPVKVGPGQYEHQAEEGLYTIKKTGKQWTLTSPDLGEQPVESWGKGVEAISRRTARKPSFVEGMIEKPGGFERIAEAPNVTPVTGLDPHQEWARTQVEFVKGTVYGADGTLHDEILNAIAEGRAPSTEYIDSVPPESRPHRILGAHTMPAPPDRLSDRIFNKLNGFISWMAREPIYGAEMLRQQAIFQPLIDNGTLTMEEAVMRANTRAVNNIMPHIHNINERSLMSEHARNFVPFYFAQQQSFARMFRLLAEDPVAFRKMQLSYTNLADFGGIYDDGSGHHQLVMPGSGYITGKVMSTLSGMGIPVVSSVSQAFSGNLKSLASLSPFLEGSDLLRPGPLVALGARGIQNLLPEAMGLKEGFTDLNSAVLGEQTQMQSVWDMLIPNAAARSVVNVLAKTDNRSMAKSVLDAVQSLEYQQNVEMTKWVKNGSKGTAPHLVPSATATDMERQEFLDRVKSHARILTIFKGILGSVSPLAPSLQIGDYKLKGELYDMMKATDPKTGQPVGIGTAIHDYLLKHPDATPYTVFETDAGTPSPIQSTHPAQQWVKTNMGFITDHRFSSAASYFVPQTSDAFSQSVYNEQMAMGLRHTKAPDQLIKDIHVAEGNRWYFDTYKPAKDAALAKANSPHERTVINEQFSKRGAPDGSIPSFESMKLTNPIWYTNFSSGGRDADRQVALSQMRTAIESGNAPQSPMTEGIKGLLSDFDHHSASLLPGRTDAYASAQRNQEKAQWQKYLKNLATKEPELAMVINNVFRGA